MKETISIKTGQPGYDTQLEALHKISEGTIVDAQQLRAGLTLPEGTTLVSAGNMGYEQFKLCPGHPMVLATDRFGYEDLRELKTDDLTIIAPQCELAKYREQGIPFWGIGADLVAVPSKEVMKSYARTFVDQNKDDEEGMKALLELATADPEYFFFFGGRVFDPTEKEPNRWRENSVEQFEATAELLMRQSKGRNTLVVFHGFRSRTRADKSNDFAPQEAAIATIAKQRTAEQMVVVIATTEDGPTLIAIDKDGERRYRIQNPNAGAYYTALDMAITADAPMEFTAEQMNFVNEALTLGADWRNIHFVGSDEGWDLCLPANEETHERVFTMLENGETPLTAVDAFRRWLETA